MQTIWTFIIITSKLQLWPQSLFRKLQLPPLWIQITASLYYNLFVFVCNHCLSVKIVSHKPVYQEQTVGAQYWHKWNLHTLYQIETSLGTNCIGHKLYQLQIVSGTHCIGVQIVSGNKLYGSKIVLDTDLHKLHTENIYTLVYEQPSCMLWDKISHLIMYVIHPLYISLL